MDKGSTQTLNVVLCLEAESVLVVPESLELDTAEEIIPPSSAQTGVYGVEVWTRIFFGPGSQKKEFLRVKFGRALQFQRDQDCN